MYCVDQEIETKIIEKITATAEKGDSLGGIIEVIAVGLPVGLGSHTQWDLRLDARLVGALMSVQAIKGVEVGLGCDVANKFGSEVHDEIFYEKPTKNKLQIGGFKRITNNAGGNRRRYKQRGAARRTGIYETHSDLEKIFAVCRFSDKRADYSYVRAI